MNLINQNGVEVVIQNNKNTPRTAVCFYFSIDMPEKLSGIYAIFSKLLLQGTKNRTASQLAKELEENVIETSVKAKQDFLRLSMLFLNEDFYKAMDIARDILLNSTFDEFEKEVHKLKGEIISDLDSPRVKTSDAFIRTIFGNHYYAHTHTKTQEDIDKITKQDIIEVFEKLKNAKKVISVAGDIEDEEKLAEYFGKNFDFMKSNNPSAGIPKIENFITSDRKNKIIKIAKNDANQAQLIKGWTVDTYLSEDYPKIIVMNNILGAAGLSSRLFVELRDKKGLAYTVRSSYEPLRMGALFNFYIATEPKNIKKSLEGFEFETDRIIKEPPSEKELQGAKENIMGRIEYFSQTNAQLACTNGYNYIMGLGLNFEEKYRNMINSTKPEDISYAAQKYLKNPSVITVLAPEKYLNF